MIATKQYQWREDYIEGLNRQFLIIESIHKLEESDLNNPNILDESDDFLCALLKIDVIYLNDALADEEHDEDGNLVDSSLRDEYANYFYVLDCETGEVYNSQGTEIKL
jgi:hypothetical protein